MHQKETEKKHRWIVKLNAVDSGHFSFKLQSPEVLFQTPVEQIENLVSCVGSY